MASSFFFKDTTSTEIYTLSLHDALPISNYRLILTLRVGRGEDSLDRPDGGHLDRKSTRLNSSHTVISYAVFCLKKKNLSRKISLCIKRIIQYVLDMSTT